MIQLSTRLAAVAELVPAGASVIDVGTDHARLPVWLVQTGRAPRALATDIRPGPLRSAAALVEKTGTGEKIRLLRTDGLTGVGAADGEAIVIAGMGGETMIRILAGAPWARDSACLILEPQSKRADLRRWLMKNGWRVTSERLVEEAGHIYPILRAIGGVSPAYTEAELHLGLLDQIGADPLFPRYLAALTAQCAKAAPYDGDAAALLKEYEKLKEDLCYDNSQ